MKQDIKSLPRKRQGEGFSKTMCRACNEGKR
jgi:hypothetical protein